MTVSLIQSDTQVARSAPRAAAVPAQTRERRAAVHYEAHADSAARHDALRVLLARAATRATDALLGGVAPALNRAEVRVVVARTISRIAAAQDGPPSLVVNERSGVSVLSGRVLEAIQSAILEHAPGAGVDPWLIVDAIRAIDAVRVQMESSDVRAGGGLTRSEGIDLVVDVVHDLRSPLTAILLLTEAMLSSRETVVTAERRRQLGLVYGAALGLRSVANDMIDAARGGTQLVEPEGAPFSIADLVESVCGVIRPIADEKRLDLRVALNATDFRIGHRVALGRVLLNLTTNALRFTDTGFVEIAAAASGPTTVEFSVRDSGSGIVDPPPAVQRRSDRRLSPGDELAFSGDGLGLAICGRLLAAMGSTLHVTARRPQGTQFLFAVGLPEAAGIRLAT